MTPRLFTQSRNVAQKLLDRHPSTGSVIFVLFNVLYCYGRDVNGVAELNYARYV